MALLFSESFDGGAPGSAITTTGTAFTYTQDSPKYTADSVLGAGGMRCTYGTGTDGGLGEITHGVLTAGYYRWYTKLIATGTLFYIFQTLSGTTVRAAMSIDGQGGARMRQGTTAIGVASTTKINTTAHTRIEFGITATTVQVRLYQGDNLHGTTATYDSGPVAWTSPGSWDRVRIGTVLTVAGVDVLHDEFAASDTGWVGPATTSTVPATRNASAVTAVPHTTRAAASRVSRVTATTTAGHTGVASAAKTPLATAVTPVPHTGSATASAPHRATATTATTHTGSAVSSTPHRAAAVTTVSHTGAATAARPSTASATTAVPHTGSASAVTPAVGVQQATARTVVPHTGSALSASAHTASAATSVPHTGYAVASRPSVGQLSASARTVVPHSGTAAASSVHRASARTVTPHGGYAAASARHTASAVTLIRHTAVAQGQRVSLASAVTEISHTGRAFSVTPGRGQDITATAAFAPSRYAATLSARDTSGAFASRTREARFA